MNETQPLEPPLIQQMGHTPQECRLALYHLSESEPTPETAWAYLASVLPAERSETGLAPAF